MSDHPPIVNLSNSPRPPALRSFASTDRFLTEIASPASLRPGYVLLGDEAFLYQRCRQGVLAALAPPESRDFSLHDFDLADTTIFDILDRAQTPSLMAPFQVLFVRGLKNLYGRGSKKEEFAAIDAYFRSPNPGALVLFVADHLRIPTDLRKMDYQDKERYDRIRETLGDWCGFVELARVDENDAIKWVTAHSPKRAASRLRRRRRPRTGRCAGRRHDDGRERTRKALPLCLRPRAARHPRRRGDHGACRQAAFPLRTHRRHLAARSHPRPAAPPRPAQRLRRRRRCGHRPPLHAGPHLPPDAHHPREKRARLRAIWARILWRGASACRPSPPKTSSARPAATNPAANSPAPFAWS